MRSLWIVRGIAALTSAAVLLSGFTASIAQPVWAFSPATPVTAGPAPDQTASGGEAMPEPDFSGLVKEDIDSTDPVLPVAPAPVAIVNEDGTTTLAPPPDPTAPQPAEKLTKEQAAFQNAMQPEARSGVGSPQQAPQETKEELPPGVYDANQPDYAPWAYTEVNPTAPTDRAINQSVTPTLTGELKNANSNAKYQFRYLVCAERQVGFFSVACGAKNALVDSEWISPASWTVPSGKLEPNKTYLWAVFGQNISSPTYAEPIGSSVGAVYFSTGPKISTGLAPWPKGVTPQGETVTSPTPALESKIVDGEPGANYEFNFQVEVGGQPVWRSGWLRNSKVTVPEKQLYWNTVYTWSTAIRKAGTTEGSTYYVSGSFQVAAPKENGKAAWSIEGTSPNVRNVNLGTGSFTFSTGDAALKLGSASFDITRTYRSGDTRKGVFGQGWSSVLDMKVRQSNDVLGTFVSTPDGREYAFATNPDGTFAPSLSNPGIWLTKCKDCADWTLRELDGTSYVFDATGLKGMSTPYGSKLNVTRDSGGRPVTLADGYSNRTLALGWSSGKVSSIEPGPKIPNAAIRWDYSYAGDLLNKICAPGNGNGPSCTNYQYQNDRIVGVTVPSGKPGGQLRYDSEGKVLSVESPTKGPGSFAWSKDGDNTKVTMTAPEAADAGSYSLDSQSRLTKYLNPLNGESNWIYDASGRLISVRAPEGGRTDYSYDAQNRLQRTKIWRSADTVTYKYVSYDSKGYVWSQGLAKTPYQITRDADGRIITYETLCGFGCGPSITKYSYTDGKEAAVDGGTVPANLAKTSTNPLGGTTEYQYDQTGLLKSSKSPTGLLTSYEYDVLGRNTSISETGDGITTKRMLGVNEDGSVATVISDEERDVVSGKQRKIVTSTERDSDGKATSSTVEDTNSKTKSTNRYAYDDAGRLAEITDPAGKIQSKYNYSSGGLVSSISTPNRSDQAYTFDAMGNTLTSSIKNYSDPVSAKKAEIVTERNSFDSAGRRTSSTDASGQIWQNTFSTDGYLLKVTALGRSGKADRVQQENFLDSKGNPTKQRLWDSSIEILTTFNGLNLPFSSAIAVPESNGSAGYTRASMTSYNGLGQPELRWMTSSIPSTSVALKDSLMLDYSYDNSGTLTGRGLKVPAYGPDGFPTSVFSATLERFGYDSRGRQVRATDGRGTELGDPKYTTESVYSPLGKLLSVKGPEITATDSNGAKQAIRPTTQFGYDALGQLTASITPDGAKTTSELDLLGRTTKITLPAVQLADGTTASPTQNFNYNDAGDLLAKTSPGGQRTEYTYDSLGNPVRVLESGATPNAPPRISSTSYRPDGLVAEATGPSGIRATFDYDELGRKTTQSVTAPGAEPRKTGYSYDTPGNVTSVSLPNGGVIRNSYDVLGQLTKQTDPDGISQTFAYDNRGNQTRATDALGQVSLQAYDFANRPTESSVQSLDGTVVAKSTNAYDLAGNLISTTGPMGTGTTQEWDGANRLLKRTDPTNATIALGYDAVGRRTQLTDARGNTTSYGYNALGWKTTDVLPAIESATSSSKTRSWAYDINGWPKQITDLGGVTTTQSYDLDGNLLRQEGTGAVASTASRVLSYDNLGRLSTASHPNGTQNFTYDAWGTLASSQGPAGNSAASFNAAGQLNNRTDAAGATSFEWTPGGRLKAIRSDKNSLSSTFSYNAIGSLEKKSDGGNTVSVYQQDAAGRPLTEKITSGSTTLYDWSGSYDAASRLVESTQSASGVSGRGTTQYSYDANNRLSGWKDPDGAENPISYDAAGNVTNLAGTARSFDSRNRITSNGATSYQWSDRGTLNSQSTPASKDGPARSTQFTFDAFGQLTDDGSTKYSYDGLKRTAKADGASFSYNLAGRSPASDGVTGWLRTPAGTPWASASGAYLLGNTRGDIIASVSDGQLTKSTSFTPYGQPKSQDKPGEGLGYQGAWTAKSGLVGMDARWYSPDLGGFVSQDTADVPLDQNNLYGYALGNPLSYVDPTGNFQVPVLPPPGPLVLPAIGGGATGAAAVAGGSVLAATGVGLAALAGVAGLGYVTYQVFKAGEGLDKIPKFTGGPGLSGPLSQYTAPSSMWGSGSGTSSTSGSTGAGQSYAPRPTVVPSKPYLSGVGTGLGQGIRGAVQGVNAFNEGIRGFSEGIRGFSEGIRAFSEGIRSLIEGMRAANEGIRSFTEGVRSATEGVRAFTEGIRSATEGVRAFTEGIRSATEGVNAFNESLRGVINALRAINEVFRSLGDSSLGRPWAPYAYTAAGAAQDVPNNPGPNTMNPRLDPPRPIAKQELPPEPAAAGAGAGKPPVCTPKNSGGGDDLGVVYLRTDRNGIVEPYVGQAKDSSRFQQRRNEHQRGFPLSDFKFTILDRAPSGTTLDKLEEDYIRACGGAKNKSNPGGDLSNKRYQMNNSRYQESGGIVPKPGN